MNRGKSLATLLSVALLAVLLTACSVNVDEVRSSADEAFKTKNYQVFNEQYDKLSKANNDEATLYLNKMKENPIFSPDTYESSTELSDGVTELTMIVEKVPSLSEYAKKKTSELNNKLSKINIISSTIRYINDTQVEELENITSDANTFVMLMKEYEDVKKTTSALENLSSGLNSHIIEVESIVEKDNNTNGLLDAMRNLKTNLDSKTNFLKTNSALIISSNSLISEGNFFSMINVTDLSEEVESLDSQITTSLNDLKQRAESAGPPY
ncbi:hypothetical protein M3629_08910 [Paenibacillus polysaccharolyticus]|uniref:hypothetical protein n=1 Tax=Paenibacillus polysaccharolyticus TaxID=582692 RepID=UPI0020413EDF|nr:hypothetical protein [Paenibacillus polysaccharolyticus]MCM3132904.1 hypothetical protein [Paenibacillus polysaccharolyticus]